MTLAESIYQRSLNLPESAAREALDFIEFLEMRYGLSGNVLPGHVKPEHVKPEHVKPEHVKEEKRVAALEKLADIRLPFEGKPVSNREELYDDARG